MPCDERETSLQKEKHLWRLWDLNILLGEPASGTVSNQHGWLLPDFLQLAWPIQEQTIILICSLVQYRASGLVVGETEPVMGDNLCSGTRHPQCRCPVGSGFCTSALRM